MNKGYLTRINHFPTNPQKMKLVQNLPNSNVSKKKKIYKISKSKLEKFYKSREWIKLSYQTKIIRGRKCECCGAEPPKVRINTDHVKPIKKYWDLRFDPNNLQILCEDCNLGKGSWDETDFRN